MLGFVALFSEQRPRLHAGLQIDLETKLRGVD